MRPLQRPTDTFIGPNDEPSADDWLNVQKHVQGLTRFVADCHPPLTIAVQGGWGTGKTTILNMVRTNLAEQRKSNTEAPTQVFVDVWQAAFASSSEDIIVGLVYAIADALVAESGQQAEGVKGKAEDIKKLLRRWLPSRYALAGAALAGASRAVEPTGLLAHLLVQVVQEVQEKGESSAIHAAQLPDGSLTQSTDQPVTGADVRRCFHELMEKRYGPADTRGRARLVVFIDNLDRLNPQQAVEIMECLKAILDAPHCVFVVAVDFDVVAEGIKLKYPSMGPEKARAFFDKIIQLPFHVPVGSYDMSRFVAEVFEQEGDSDDVETTTRIIDASVGPNPRSVKRIVNSYRLLTLINDSEGARNLDLKLVALIALQIAYPAVYQYLDTSDLSELAAGLTKIAGEDEDAGQGETTESARATAKELLGEADRHSAGTAGVGLDDPMTAMKRNVDIDRLAALLTEMAKLYPTGKDLKALLNDTWRLASTTATEATGRRTKAEPISRAELQQRLSDIKVPQENKDWTLEFTDALQRHAEGRGQMLRMTMRPGDRRIRLAFVEESRPDVSLGAVYVQRRMKLEANAKSMHGDRGVQDAAFEDFVTRHRDWEWWYDKGYNQYYLQTPSPRGAGDLADVFDGLVPSPRGPR